MPQRFKEIPTYGAYSATNAKRCSCKCGPSNSKDRQIRVNANSPGAIDRQTLDAQAATKERADVH